MFGSKKKRLADLQARADGLAAENDRLRAANRELARRLRARPAGVNLTIRIRRGP